MMRRKNPKKPVREGDGHKTIEVECLMCYSTKKTHRFPFVIFFVIFSDFYDSAKWIV